MSRLQPAAIHIDRITQCLEGIKRDANRQDDIPGPRWMLDPERMEQFVECLEKESEVFEETKDAQIDADGQEEPAPARTRIGRASQGDADAKIDQARQQDQAEKAPVPPTVKKVAGDDDEGVALAQIVPRQSVQQDENDKKQQE